MFYVLYQNCRAFILNIMNPMSKEQQKRDIPLFERMPFECFTKFLLQCNRARKPADRKHLLYKVIIDPWRASYEVRKTSPVVPLNKNDSFYTILRLFYPNLDLVRPAYGLGETRLVNLIADVLGIPKKSPDHKKLLSFNKTEGDDRNQAESSNLPEIVEEVLTSRCHAPQGPSDSVTVVKVNNLLDMLSASNSDEIMKKELRAVLCCLSPMSIRWLVSIILRHKLAFRLNDSVMFTCYHPDAITLFHYQADLRHVCDSLTDETQRLNKKMLACCRPFVWCQPMLSDKISIGNIEKKLKGSEFYIETKFDGERFQLHKNGSAFRYYSRRGHFKFSSKFGENFDEGTLTPYLKNAFHDNAYSVILDGEMMFYDSVYDELVPKALADADVKFNSGKRQGHLENCYVVFDILYFNGKSMTETPLCERLKVLESVVKPVSYKLILANRTTHPSTNVGEIAEALRVAMERGDEGLIVKLVDSKYSPTARDGGWIKIKPDYSNQLVDDLDLLVMGADYGTGARRNVLSSFVCGVRDSSTGEDQYLALASVGSGFPDHELLVLNNELLPPVAIKFKDVAPPPNMLFGTGKKPTFWFKPEKSLVFSIKATEVNPSKGSPTQRTLRFPRFRSTRRDRSCQDCMTAQELNDLKLGPICKQNLSAEEIATAGDDMSPAKRRKKTQPDILGAVQLPSKQVAAMAASNSAVDFFTKKQICIVNTPTSRSTEIFQRLKDFGALKTAQPIKGQTHFLVAYKRDVTVESLIKENFYDILSGKWFDECIKTNSFVEPKSLKWFTHATPTTRRRIGGEFGNSFTEDTIEEVCEVFKNRKIGSPEGCKSLDQKMLADFIDEFQLCPSKYSLFRNYVAYFSPPRGEFYTDSQFNFLLYGGEIVDDLDDASITHFIVTTTDERDWLGLSMTKRLHLVSPAWIAACIEDGQILEDRFFRP